MLDQAIGEVFHDELFSNFFNFTPIACSKPDLSFPAKSHNTQVQSELFYAYSCNTRLHGQLIFFAIVSDAQSSRTRTIVDAMLSE